MLPNKPKSQILSVLAEDTELSKKEVTAVLDALAELAHAHLKKGGSGEFSVPSLGIKLRRVIKPAREAREGTNPFTGEKIMIKAKPASNRSQGYCIESSEGRCGILI